MLSEAFSDRHKMKYIIIIIIIIIIVIIIVVGENSKMNLFISLFWILKPYITFDTPF